MVIMTVEKKQDERRKLLGNGFDRWIRSGQSTIMLIVMVIGIISWFVISFQTIKANAESTQQNSKLISVLERDNVRLNTLLDQIRVDQKAVNVKLDKILDIMIQSSK